MLKNSTFLFFLCLSLSPLEAQDVATQSRLWSRHTILLYTTPSKGAGGAMSKADAKWSAAYCSIEGVPKDYFFDGFLILGFSCKEGRHLLPLPEREPATRTDWEDALESYLATAEQLSQAIEEAAAALSRPPIKGKVILALPYPDRRQRAFTLPEGKKLDLAKNVERIVAMRWYVNEAVQRWAGRAKQGLFKGVSLTGLYWSHESIGDADIEVVKGTAACVHDKALLMHWIPCLGGARKDWRELGIDCVTQQINYQNPQKPGRPLTIFDENSRLVADLGLHGVEMTPMARDTQLNPRIWSWHQVHLANLEAALRLNWSKYPAITYFHGNDLPKIGADPKSRIFYDKLYRWVKGLLTREDIHQIAMVTLDEQKSRGFLDGPTYTKAMQSKSISEKLRIMEESKLEVNRKDEARLLATYSCSSGNLLRDGSFEKGMENWPVVSGGLTRTQEVVHTGQWSLQLVQTGGGRDIVRVYAKSVRIPVKGGQLVRLSAWVKVPQELKETNRGVIIGLSRFRQGKCIATWNDCECGQTKATEKWVRLNVHLFVDEKPCDEVEAIIGLCGRGVAYVDDVELVTLSKP